MLPMILLLLVITALWCFLKRPEPVCYHILAPGVNAKFTQLKDVEWAIERGLNVMSEDVTGRMTKLRSF